MEEWQERVLQEKNELQVRLERLMNFTGSEKFQGLNEQYKALMIEQQSAMFLYLAALDRRVQLFETIS